MVLTLSLHAVKTAFILSSTRRHSPMVSTDVRSVDVTAGFPSSGTVAVSRQLDILSTPTIKSIDEPPNINNRVHSQVGPIHFCFIVHGHKGHANDLWYLHQSVRDKAREHDAFYTVESSKQCVVGAKLNTDSIETNESPRRNKINSKRPTNDATKDDDSTVHGSLSSCNNNASDRLMLASMSSFIVHNSICNEGKTDDGVINGGNRLADEMVKVIRFEVKKKKRLLTHDEEKITVDVTLSLIGNSLGGLYTRYAIARLAEISNEIFENQEEITNASNDSKNYYVITDGNTRIRVHFNVFCTTASPHLGCADHTYFPIPRVAEKGIAYGLGKTGRDLFRVNALLYEMAIARRFLEPLSRFRKRVAYANAFGTDFVVPTNTAAFLDEESSSLHYFEEYFEENIDQMAVDKMKQDMFVKVPTAASTKAAKGLDLIVATFYTKREYFEKKNTSKNNGNDLSIMSSSLDALGWKKVFVDMRRELPFAVSIPIISITKNSFICPIQKLKFTKQVVESRDLAKVASGNPSKATVISLPLGHNAICAMSRGTVTLAMNSGGIPVVDSLASQLIKDISSW